MKFFGFLLGLLGATQVFACNQISNEASFRSGFTTFQDCVGTCTKMGCDSSSCNGHICTGLPTTTP